MATRLLYVLITLIVGLSVAHISRAADDDVPDFFLNEGEGVDDFADVPAADTAPAPAAKPTKKAKIENPKKVEEPNFMAEPDATTAMPEKAQAPLHAAAKGKEGFRYLKEDCNMHRAPASESPTVLKVKGARKLWVEQMDSEWFKGFRKDGAPGYISAECFE